MSAQVCPVCGGKGLVRNGFYDVGSTNPGETCKTTSATPETCRSCGGKGYIIEYPPCEIPVYNTFKSCSICNKNDGLCYTSNTLKYRCMLDGEFHTADYSCDKFGDTSFYGTIGGKVLENHDLKLNSTSTNSNTIEVENKEG